MPETAAPSGASAAVERASEALLAAAFKNGAQSVFDFNAASDDDDTGEHLLAAKTAADQLVRLKMAKYADEGRTEIVLTNAGRYWALNGGYMAFLKEEPPSGGGGGRNRNPEHDALRFEYMKLRMNTFWWTFGLSAAGFIISIISVAIAVFYGDRFVR